MKKLTLALLLLAGCTQQPTDLSSQSATEILKADRAMSELAAKEGFFKALLYYADDSVVKPKEGELPVIGKTALVNYWSSKKDTKAITWEPFKAEAARSGELGYTLGNWKMTAGDSAFYGFYYTIWKKHTDGSWRFVVDGGNNMPRPVQ